MIDHMIVEPHVLETCWWLCIRLAVVTVIVLAANPTEFVGATFAGNMITAFVFLNFHFAHGAVGNAGVCALGAEAFHESLLACDIVAVPRFMAQKAGLLSTFIASKTFGIKVGG